MDASLTTEGYDPGFLGPAVPLPTSSAPTQALTYPHFTVVLDLDRRLARTTAVNIDGESVRDLPRTGEWRLDPRAPAETQTGPDVYARNDLDRGHLVRRRDPGWGESDEARRATEATFFYTNAAPQAAGFNQSKELWLGLEDHVLEYAETTDTRVSVFTAPILGDDDPPYRGIRVPLRFWKIAAWATADPGTPLAASGFLLDQSELVDTRQGATAVAPLGAFRTFQVPISDIAGLAGVDLGPLVEADVLPRTGVRPTPWREITSAPDITLD
ncbi:DNA/RNA non-specific endonuclease [Microbacterium sp. P06]|uniref:DNA/RNA non-specific endonuclease n=1 Tax=Microbacterium sp. P06 TaxID=3366949 RepID=UPI00374630B5